MKHSEQKLEEAFRLIAQTNSKKILFACVPGDGHFNPLTGLAKYLQAAGYDVRWYTGTAYAKKLERLQIHHYPFDKALEVNGENIDIIFQERNSIKNPVKRLNFDIINVFIKRAPEYYADLINIYKSFSFDLVVADCAFTAIPFITDKMNIPVISIGVFPLVETSKDLAPAGVGKTPSYTFWGKQRQAIERWVADRLLFSPSNKFMRRLMKEYDIEVGKLSLFDVNVKKSTLLLQSGTPGFEYKRSDLGKNIRFIGSLLPYRTSSEKDAWFDERLINYSKIVLVTQGTVEKDIEKLLVPSLEAFKNTDTLVVCTTGGTKTDQLKKRFPHANVIIEDYIPFADIMPYATVYITNGGYGGVMLGIKHHLPMVVAGVHEGKNEINARIGYFNLGINLKTETPSVLQIKKATEAIMQDPLYKENVIRLADEFNEYDPEILFAKYVRAVLNERRSFASRLEVAEN